MKPLHVALSASLAIALAAAQPSLGAEAAKAKPAAAAKASAAADPADIEPEAVTALQRMSAYLGTLKAFEIKSDTSLELVRDDGQKIEIDGTATTRCKRPNAFRDRGRDRQEGPAVLLRRQDVDRERTEAGLLLVVPAPPTIRETLDLARDRYGIVLPLEDLFRWSDPAQARTGSLQSAMVVGTSTIDGVQCDQYAFREGDIDWQIWIQKGDSPCRARW